MKKNEGKTNEKLKKINQYIMASGNRVLRGLTFVKINFLWDDGRKFNLKQNSLCEKKNEMNKKWNTQSTETGIRNILHVSINK